MPVYFDDWERERLQDEEFLRVGVAWQGNKKTGAIHADRPGLCLTENYATISFQPVVGAGG